MALHLLLFSGDARSALLLGKLLAEFDIEVEFCSEIFVSVEKVTSQPFDAIIVDWDEGTEASFLLKTARELKSTRECLTLALVSDAAAAACARQVGAHGTLHKPLMPREVRETFSAVREFVATRQRSSETRPAPLLTLVGSRGVPEHPSAKQGPVAQLPSAPPVLPDPSQQHDVTEPHRLSEMPPPQNLFHADEAYPSLLFSSLPYANQSSSSVKSIRKRAARLAILSIFLVTAALLYNGAVGATFVNNLLSRAASNQDSAGDHTQVTSITVDGWDSRGRQASQIRKARRTRTGSSPDVGVDSQAPYSPQALHEAEQLPAVIAQSLEQQLSGSTQPAEPNPSSGKPYDSRSQVPESLRISNVIFHGPPASADPITTLSNSMRPIILSEDDAASLLLTRVLPAYPEAAVHAGIQGAVVLQAWIARDGSIRDLKLIRGYFVLGRAAFDAVRQWRYKPYYMNGQAVEAQTFITVNFRLPSLSFNSVQPRPRPDTSLVTDTSKP
jgi:TonB family protein